MSAQGGVLPPRQLRFMGESDDAFLPLTDQLAANVLVRMKGLEFDLLDVGCGYGRLAYGLRRAGFRGRYRGFDILSEHVGWLREHFAAPGDEPHYGFDFFNVHNARYNPGGLPFDDLSLPYAERSVDCITAFSVFTHMYEDDVRQYLRRIGALLRDGGIWVATFFSVPADFSLATQPATISYRLTEQVSEHAFIHNPAEPLHVIAYKENFLRRLFAEEGLAIVSHEPGAWLAGPGAGAFQDWYVLRKLPAANTASAAAAATAVTATADAATAAAATAAAGPTCNICGSVEFRSGPAGRMASTGAPPCCLQCGALERQRLVRHLFQAMPIGFLDWRRSLQFSPDQAQNPAWFRSHEVSVYNGDDSLDIQAIARPDASYDFITLSHVLECIPRDLAAFDELNRVLSPRGLLHISFGGAQSRPVSRDFDASIDPYNNLHLYGRDVYRRFRCAEKGMGMLAVEGGDPVTGARDVAHLFVKHGPDLALLRGWLLAWDPTLAIVDEAMP